MVEELKTVDITSMNLLAWLRINGINFNYGINDDGYVYGTVVVDEEYEQLVREFRGFKELQAMLHEFKVIKQEMFQFKAKALYRLGGVL